MRKSKAKWDLRKRRPTHFGGLRGNTGPRNLCCEPAPKPEGRVGKMCSNSLYCVCLLASAEARRPGSSARLVSGVSSARVDGLLASLARLVLLVLKLKLINGDT